MCVFWLSDRSKLAVIGRSHGPLVEKTQVYAACCPLPHEASPVLDKSHGSSPRLPPRGGDRDPELSAPIRIYSPRHHLCARRVSEPHPRRGHVAFGNPPDGRCHLRREASSAPTRGQRRGLRKYDRHHCGRTG